MDHKRLSMSDIAIGEPLPWDIYGTDRKLLLRKGHIVENERQIEALVARGLYVAATEAQASRRSDVARVHELPSVLRLLNLANNRLEKLLYSATGEEALDAKVLEVVHALRQACDMNPDIALGCVLLNQDAASYAVRHGTDTAIVAWNILRALHKPSEEIDTVMASALTMNVSMLRIHDQLQNRTTPLTDQEHALVRRHPRDSVELLRQAGVHDEAWLELVLHHHENDDGSGYPDGPDGPPLSQNARILAIADRYCARIVRRKYRKTLPPEPPCAKC